MGVGGAGGGGPCRCRPRAAPLHGARARQRRPQEACAAERARQRRASVRGSGLRRTGRPGRNRPPRGTPPPPWAPLRLPHTSQRRQAPAASGAAQKARRQAGSGGAKGRGCRARDSPTPACAGHREGERQAGSTGLPLRAPRARARACLLQAASAQAGACLVPDEHHRDAAREADHHDARPELGQVWEARPREARHEGGPNQPVQHKADGKVLQHGGVHQELVEQLVLDLGQHGPAVKPQRGWGVGVGFLGWVRGRGRAPGPGAAAVQAGATAARRRGLQARTRRSTAGRRPPAAGRRPPRARTTS
jgi:hypothetical protein